MQATVELSTTEAEYMSLSTTCQEALWLRNLAQDLDPSLKPMSIHCDNKGAIDLAITAAYCPRTKHIAIRLHFLRDHVQKGEIVLEYISTENMITDSLTKGLFHNKHIYCTKGMGLI